MNPAPAPINSAVYFGANSSPNRGTDVLVKSIVMETQQTPASVPEPSSVVWSLAALTCAAVGVILKKVTPAVLGGKQSG